MAYFSTIRSKMTALLLGMIVLTLLLAVMLFSFRLSILQEEAAHTVFTSAQLQMQHVFNDMDRRLRQVGKAITTDENVIAGMGLIVNYQDKNAYNAKLFDAPKQELARLLEQYASGVGLHIAVLYADNESEIFYLPSDAGQVSGYIQYDKNERHLVHSTAGSKTLRPPLFVDELVDASVERVLGEPRLKVTEKGALTYEIHIALTDVIVNENAKEAPVLRLGFLIDAEMIDKMAVDVGVDMHLRFGNTVLFSTGVPIISMHIEKSPSLMKALKQSVSNNQLYWDEFSLGMSNYMRGVTLLKVADEGWATLSFVKNTESFDYGIAAMKYTLLWLLPLLVLCLIYIGHIFSNRTIVTPLKKLTKISTQLADGHYVKIENFKAASELCCLAESFNAMSEKLQQRESDLKITQSRFANIIDNAPAAIYMKDLEGNYLLVNNNYLSLTGKKHEEVLGTTDYEHFPEEVANKFRENDHLVQQMGIPLDIEEMAEHADGSVHYYHSVKFPLRNDIGEIIATCGISSDISERKKIEQNLLLSRLVLENANEAILITDHDGNILEVNEAYEQITGFSRHEVIGKNPKIAQSGHHDAAFYKKMWHEIKTEGKWQGEIWDRRKNGELFPKWLSITTVYEKNGEATNYVAIFSDITDKKRAEEQLEKLAYYDPLTGLSNRAYFQEQLKRSISASIRDNLQLALLFIDLDRFKSINDRYGHNAGDQLLVKVAQRLNAQVRRSDTVSRLGGDEFAILLQDVKRSEQVAGIAQKVIDTLDESFEIDDGEVGISASIGISVFPNDGSEPGSIIKSADMAMYKAKEKGRNCYHFYSPDIQSQLNRRLELEENLHCALESREFSLFYQPKVDLVTGKVTGMEALLRWIKPDGEVISPADFIPVAEEMGIIVPMGKWILAEATRQTAEWNQRYGLVLKVAVNLSARQFKDDDVIAMVESQGNASGLDHSLLELEITESMVMGNVEDAITTMRKIRELGVSLAIDDFGTGYSSLNYLKRFPINTLKIDKSFISELHVNPEDASIVRAIISMAHSLGLAVVAEGVEDSAQLAFLKRHGCELAQGFYLHRPLSANDFEGVISAGARL